MTRDIPFQRDYRNEAFMQIKKFYDLEQLENQHVEIHFQLRRKNIPSNQRNIFLRRKKRLEQQIKTLKESIRVDIKNSNT